MKNRKREICTSGSVRDEDGEPPHLLGRRTFLVSLFQFGSRPRTRVRVRVARALPTRTDHVTLMRGAAAIGAGWQLGDSHHSHADTGASSEPVRRLEVFTGRRRRTWPAEQKARILAESYESGEKGEQLRGGTG